MLFKYIKMLCFHNTEQPLKQVFYILIKEILVSLPLLCSFIRILYLYVFKN